MTARLGPALTPLDYRVLHHVPRGRHVRARAIAVALSESPDTVRGVLRGLEHLGYVRQAGGWWRRA